MLDALKKYKARKYFFTLGMIIFGSGCLFVSEKVHFDNAFDPVLQTLIMFLGEFLCIGFIFIKKSKNSLANVSDFKRINNSNPSQNKLSMPWYQKHESFVYIIPATSEFINSVLEVACSNYFISPTISSLKALKIIFVICYRFIYVNRTILKHRKLGLLIQEWLMAKLDTDPAKANYIKGIFGIIMCIIFYFPIGVLFHEQNNYKEPFISLAASYEKFCYFAALIILMCFFNFFELVNLKFTESVTICTIRSSFIIFIWIVAICSYEYFLTLLKWLEDY